MKALALTLLALGTFVITQAAGLKTAVEASHMKIGAAMKKKDFVALDKIFKAGMTKDFKYVENGKTQTYDEMMQGMKMGLGQYDKITKVSTAITSIKEKGNTGSCTAKHEMAGTVKGPDKKKHTSTFSGVAEETYIKVGNTWKMSKMEWKSSKMTLDGKPMSMGGGG